MSQANKLTISNSIIIFDFAEGAHLMYFKALSEIYSL